MSSSKKAILINPEYFSLKKNKSMKKQPRDKKPKNKTGKQQKKELLKRLKDIQDNKKPIENTNDNESTSMDNTVMSSIQFLNTLSNESKSKPPVPVTPVPVTPVPVTPVPVTPVPVTPVPVTPVPVQHESLEDSTNMQKEPPYSNLKGSKKPSYREWIKQKNQTIKIDKDPVKQEIRDNLREEKFKKLQKKFKKQNKRHKTIKITETFGKRNGKVSIHIKNKDEKDKLEQEKKTLKKHTIPKIKAYLKEHNLLKIGSYAPNDVIREMYESAILSGDINNNNKDILVHNFMEN
jgi:hypothetical protein